ncbi:MAG: cytoplasmic protein [Desulfobulbus sp.]|jgi:hypothetical protein
MFFGLDRTTDEQSLCSYLRLFSSERLTSVLVPRMTGEEIDQLVDHLTGLMRRHLSDDEYHSLFLGDEHHQH